MQYPVDMTVKPDVSAHFDEPTNTITYIVSDPNTGHCAIIDSVMDIDYAAGRITHDAADKLIDEIKSRGLTLDWIIETHVHADHLSAAPYLQEKLGGKLGVGEKIIDIQETFGKIFNLPNEPLQHYGNSLISQAREQIFRDINQTLNPVFLSEEVIPPARQLYDWLIRPGKVSLQQQNIKTIVFVLDDLLRSIPMSVLYDGENYLVEQYNIALTPGLQLLTSTNNATKYKTLTGGLTAARQGFPPLPKVESELVQINSLVPSEILIDDRFTRSNFQTQIERESFSTVHLATHGQFSSNAEDTFLLTWGDKINVKDIGNLVQNKGENPIELLVLSACETAAGDRRAALGIAGVAVRSGARSTVATLWAVRDDSTALLMSEFYRRLVQPGSTKAEALRQAQLSLIDNPKYNHPYYWSSFVLIGNWQ